MKRLRRFNEEISPDFREGDISTNVKSFDKLGKKRGAPPPPIDEDEDLSDELKDFKIKSVKRIPKGYKIIGKINDEVFEFDVIGEIMNFNKKN